MARTAAVHTKSRADPRHPLGPNLSNPPTQSKQLRMPTAQMLIPEVPQKRPSGCLHTSLLSRVGARGRQGAHAAGELQLHAEVLEVAQQQPVDAARVVSREVLRGAGG